MIDEFIDTLSLTGQGWLRFIKLKTCRSVANKIALKVF